MIYWRKGKPKLGLPQLARVTKFSRAGVVFWKLWILYVKKNCPVFSWNLNRTKQFWRFRKEMMCSWYLRLVLKKTLIFQTFVFSKAEASRSNLKPTVIVVVLHRTTATRSDKVQWISFVNWLTLPWEGNVRVSEIWKNASCVWFIAWLLKTCQNWSRCSWNIGFPWVLLYRFVATELDPPMSNG